MEAKHLSLAAALVGAALFGLGQADADVVPVMWDFSKPPSDVGSSHVYDSTPTGGGTIMAKAQGEPDLVGKDAGPDEKGVGLDVAPPNPNNEIVPGTFIQLDLINLTSPPLTGVRLGFRASSVQPPDAWAVFGTNTADTLAGATLIATGNDDNLVTDLGTDIIGVFRYLDITAISGDILLAELDSAIDTNSPPVPEPASIALLGTALLGFTMLRRQRR